MASKGAVPFLASRSDRADSTTQVHAQDAAGTHTPVHPIRTPEYRESEMAVVSCVAVLIWLIISPQPRQVMVHGGDDYCIGA